jgi:hypothetical protein
MSSLFLAVLCLIAAATAPFAAAFVSIPCEQRSSTTARFGVPPKVWDPRSQERGTEFVEFPTAGQKADIKKEAKKRKARRQMTYFSLPDEETNGPWSGETIRAIWEQLTKSEMMELKGICRESKRDVYQTALWFCEDLEELIAPSSASEEDEDGDDEEEDEEGGTYLPVRLIAVNGHTALIYCPTLPTDHPDKFNLRTSVGQKNVYTARPKAPRDIRGQIIREPKPEE